MSLSVSGYVKQFYKGNAFGATAYGRTGYNARNLVSADIKAVRRAVKELGNYDYDEGEGSELMNKVQAFAEAYNHYMDSAKDVGDSDMDRYLSKLKKLTKENADEFADIGITIQSSGKLKVDKKALQDTGRYQVSKLFSEDAEYGQQAEKWMKRTNHMISRKNLTAVKQDVSKKKTDPNKPDNSQTAAFAGSRQAADDSLAQQLGLVLSGSQVDYSI